MASPLQALVRCGIERVTRFSDPRNAKRDSRAAKNLGFCLTDRKHCRILLIDANTVTRRGDHMIRKTD